MTKTIAFPGAMFFMNECADQRVFTAQQFDQIKAANQQWSLAKQRIKNTEKSFTDSIDKRRRLAFDEGYQAGLKQASEDMLDVINQCQSAEMHLSELAVSAIKKVLDDLPDDILLPCLVSSAVRKTNDSHSHIAIFVHPQFLQPVKSHLNQALAELPCLKLIEVREDPLMAKNDCRLETSLGVINANLNDQLATITQVFCGQSNR